MTQKPRRLTEEGGRPAVARLLTAISSPQAPSGMRERVWQRIDPSRARASRLLPMSGWMGLASATAAALAVVFWVRAGREVEPLATVGWVTGKVQIAVSGGALSDGQVGQALSSKSRVRTMPFGRVYLRFSDAGAVIREGSSLALGRAVGRRGVEVKLLEGEVAVAVQPRAAEDAWVVSAGEFQVRVVGTVFSVRAAAGGEVGVHVREGTVEVTGPSVRQYVRAGESWSSKAGAGRAPMDATSSALVDGEEATYAEAKRLAGQGRYAAAAQLYGRVAEGSGLLVEIALYEVGRIRLKHLGEPEGAKAAFERYRTRFPAGSLGPEVQLGLIESHLNAGTLEKARAELDEFTARYPDSEHLSEVLLLRANVRREQGDCAQALQDYEQVLAAPESRGAEDALFFAAYCEGKRGNRAAAREKLQRYRTQFPSGKHRSEVDRALAGGR